jgi:hypothetical protein
MALEDGAPLGNLLHKVIQFDPRMLIEVKSTDEPGKQNAADWIFSMTDGKNVQALADILLVCKYTVKF